MYLKPLFLFVVSCVLSQFAFASGQSGQNLIVNGSFEDIGSSKPLPGYGSPNTWQIYKEVPGWKSYQNLEIWLDGFIVPPYHGKRVLELNAHPGNSNGQFKIFQSFETQAGKTYRLTFAARKREKATERFSVSVADFSKQISDHDHSKWKKYQFEFKAQKDKTKLIFASKDGGNDTTGNLLDQVSVHLVGGSSSNKAPKAYKDEVKTQEGTPIIVDVLANDKDPDGDQLKIIAVSNVDKGSATIIDDGKKVKFTPKANYTGKGKFYYTISDGNGGKDTAKVYVEVTEKKNQAPKAYKDEVTTQEGTSIIVDVLANDKDPDGDQLKVIAVSNVDKGSATIVDNGKKVKFTPKANYIGKGKFYYTISDGNGGKDTAKVYVQVTEKKNSAPVAKHDSATVKENESVTINVLANDTDQDGDPLQVTIKNGPSMGTAVVNSAQKVVYTPNKNFNGSDSFSYLVKDGRGGEASAQVIIKVTSVNELPDAKDDEDSIAEDEVLIIDVLANDTDPDMDALTITAVADVDHGVAEIVDGKVKYTPPADFHGTAKFNYTVNDGNGGQDTARVYVTVTSVNDEPVAMDDTAATLENGSATIDVLANDTDVEDDQLSIESFSQGSNGSVEMQDGLLVYTPNNGFIGVDSFTYFITDGVDGSNTATVTVTVNDLSGENDQDGDGIPDSVEGTADPDLDGDPNYLDVDSDGDGILDNQENPDYDNNGIIDTDNDGIGNYLDLDSDDDGVSDEMENPDCQTLGLIDTDNDGFYDYVDLDSDNDGIPDKLEGIHMSDTDALPDRIDLDSDDDGLYDAFEAQQDVLIDADEDGVVDNFIDANLDGLTDQISVDLTIDELADTDADELPDYRDAVNDANNDQDGDGIPDDVEGDADPDQDGDGNYMDTDSDGDGIDDNIENPNYNNNGLIDTDGDTVPDYLDLDSDNDGILDALESTANSDNDMTPDRLDLDSDNDALFDAYEAQLDVNIDANNDGLVEPFEDANGDGLSDQIPLDLALADLADSDLDGILDFRDALNSSDDADQDGIPDLVEGTEDSDGDGDGNYLDTDSDDDGVPDSVENPNYGENGLVDSDNDGVYDYLDLDSDNDSIPDQLEGTRDSDNDQVADRIDEDSDNDQIVDANEAQPNQMFDNNGDGQLDNFIDMNRDGLHDSISPELTIAELADTDNDGLPDYRDVQDSDNDGIPDNVEGDDDRDNDTDGNSNDTDSDGDGIPDSVENPDYMSNGLIDTDGDGIADFLDLDSDNDGISDEIEGLLSSDEDDNPDRIDLDSDNDGLTDAFEAQLDASADADKDGVVDGFTDANSDGLHDGVSLDLSQADLADSDVDTVPDYRDNQAGAGGSAGGVGSSSVVGDGSGKLSTGTGSMSFQFTLLVLFAVLTLGRTTLVSAETFSSEYSDEDFEKYFQFGAGVGYSFLDPEGVSNGFSTNDDTDIGFKFFVGQRFMPHWSWEFSYLLAGEAGLGNSLVPGGGTIEYNIPAVFGRYHLKEPGSKLDFFGKAGLSKISNDSSPANVQYEQESDMQFAVGIGLDYLFNDNWFARVEFDRYSRDASYLGFAIGFQPGYSSQQEEYIAPPIPDYIEPEPIIEEPIVVPVEPVAIYEPAVCEKFEGRLDRVNFQIDSAVLMNEALTVLDELALDFEKYEHLKVEIEAHTDSDGDLDYNQNLSYKRAEAVAWYLSQQGVDQNRFVLRGFGEEKPIASNLTKEGRALNRRVELVVTNPEVCK